MGNITLQGATSGQITVSPPAVAGTNTVSLPAATGTALVSSTAINSAITGTPSASNYLRGDGTWAAISASGQLIRAPQILTSGTSYTTPSTCNNIFVELIGGGGGGGGVNTATVAQGGNGGAATYGTKFVSVTPSTAYTIAIGSGGSGGTGNAAGSSGGNTSITIGATTYTSGGGGGGGGSSSGGGSAGSNGTATNCDQTLAPISAYAASSSPLVYAGGSVLTPNGTFIGALTPAGTASSTGSSATAYGCGASGGRAVSGSSQNGGSGFQGMMRIWEYT